MIGATVYTFSIILGIFLVGLGSAVRWGRRWCGAARIPARSWAGARCCWRGGGVAAWVIADSLPYWPINPFLSTNLWFTFQLDIVRCMWAMLPAALLWGASFPLALAAASERGDDAGRLVGRVYAANSSARLWARGQVQRDDVRG